MQIFPLTFLEPVPEGAWSAHGASLLVQGHAGVPQSVVSTGVERDVLIGQAVVTETSNVDLSRGGWTGGCENGRKSYISVLTLDPYQIKYRKYLQQRQNYVSEHKVRCVFSMFVLRKTNTTEPLTRWDENHEETTLRVQRKEVK